MFYGFGKNKEMSPESSGNHPGNYFKMSVLGSNPTPPHLRHSDFFGLECNWISGFFFFLTPQGILSRSSELPLYRPLLKNSLWLTSDVTDHTAQ
jgi:hypothetical protein